MKKGILIKKSGLEDWFRRIKFTLGIKAAVTGAARKLARILRRWSSTAGPYDLKRLGNPELIPVRNERYLRRQAGQPGFNLTPVHGEVS